MGGGSRGEGSMPGPGIRRSGHSALLTQCYKCYLSFQERDRTQQDCNDNAIYNIWGTEVSRCKENIAGITGERGSPGNDGGYAGKPGEFVCSFVVAWCRKLPFSWEGLK